MFTEVLFLGYYCPNVMLNVIAIEAYKKYVLVSLIVNGQVHFHSALSTAV